jgi:hypothetical protein
MIDIMAFSVYPDSNFHPFLHSNLIVQIDKSNNSNYTMAKNKTIIVKGTPITIFRAEGSEYISLTDIARHKDERNTDDIIKNWLRNRNTIELLGFWEMLYNPEFKPVEFDGFRRQAGLNSFTMSPKKWIETTHATGIISKSGRYGGTFAHKDIAFEFASWISIEFRLYMNILWKSTPSC